MQYYAISIYTIIFYWLDILTLISLCFTDWIDPYYQGVYKMILWY